MNSHTTQDPYAPFETFEDKGKHKGHPTTPEPSAYGAILLAIVVILVLLRRHARGRDK